MNTPADLPNSLKIDRGAPPPPPSRKALWIALGADLPALYANDDALANDWLAAGNDQRDPCGGCRCGGRTCATSPAASPTSPMAAARRWPAA